MAQVEIIAALHYFEAGARGRQGGAPSNDKIWGIAKVGSTLVRFWARRNGALKFKTEINGIPHDVLQEKLDKGYCTMGSNYQAAFTPRLAADMPRQYYSAMSRGQLNTRH